MSVRGSDTTSASVRTKARVVAWCCGLAWLTSCIAACRENDRFEDFRRGARPITGPEAGTQLRGVFEGEYLGTSFALCLDDDGRARGRMGEGYDEGTYELSPHGLLCTRWKTWSAGVPVCAQYYRVGAELVAYDYQSGRRVTRARKVTQARCAPASAASPAQP